jgi:2-polyprenyl-3-methyl-5-hydroxy-6-metoxy-1,4-benzoquinol methylase
MSKEFWNERYKVNETVYGNEPNVFFREQLVKLEPGKLLLPAEGEGRNALFAAQSGWQVEAFDYSEEAMEKTKKAARENYLQLTYTLKEIESIKLVRASFNVIGLIYVHLKPSLRKVFHRQCVEALKPGGTLILEAFSDEQINNQSGGPKDLRMLYSMQELLNDFEGLHISHSSTEDIFLNEGAFHTGIADVVRVVASKKY